MQAVFGSTSIASNPATEPKWDKPVRMETADSSVFLRRLLG
jgi:hypothetical protein